LLRLSSTGRQDGGVAPAAPGTAVKVIIFGATGMVGQGVLRECVLDAGIPAILLISRTASGRQPDKVREILHRDFFDFTAIESQLSGYDACFFCLGATSAGLSEAQYRRLTYDITLTAAQTLCRLNPDMTFIFVSGAGTDSTEHGRTMWARVKGATENALLRLPFKAAYMFRPGAIQPLHGIKSKTASYRVLYTLTRPLLPLLLPLLPKYMTTTEQLGRAMITAARKGAPKQILESLDISNLRPA
jgi:uncharacterized protein YbjT (DUF2867 family)